MGYKEKTKEELIQDFKKLKSENQQLKKSLDEYNEHMEATLNALPDLLFEVDKEGLIYQYHSARADLLYAPPQEFIGKTISQILPEQIAASIMNTINKVVTKRKGEVITYNLETPAGLRWFELSIAVKGDPDKPEGRLIALARDITKRKKLEQEKEQIIQQLKEAMANIKTLKGLIPICMNCKNVRDDKGYWHKVEAYIHEHSDADFSHGLCPDCIKKFYPDYKEEEE